MSFLRLFTALPVPQACRDLLAEFLGGRGWRTASRISWTRPENWHLTLKFLGDVADTDLDAVKRVLAGVSVDSFTLQPGGAGFFPNPKRPRVAWVGLAQGAAECVRLVGAVDAALADLGFEPEKRPSKPHLTVARIRHDAGDDWPALAQRLQAVPWPETQARGFTLYKSDLTPKGPIYTSLGDFF